MVIIYIVYTVYKLMSSKTRKTGAGLDTMLALEK